MTQRILVVLDPDSDTPVATDVAIDIARRHQANVTGLAFIDKDSIGADTAGGGIGSYYYASKLRETLTDETRQRAGELLAQFTQRVEAAGVGHTGDRVGEDSLGQEPAGRDADARPAGGRAREPLLLLPSPSTGRTRWRRSWRRPRPAMLIVGGERREIRRVAVAYDGSAASARTLQKFAHLSPFGTDLDIEVVHVRGGSEADRLASDHLRGEAAAYLGAHGYSRVTTTGIESDDPADRISELAQGDRADLVVSGAYAKTGFRKLVFGSSATQLLDQAKVPLFLYH